MIAVGWSPRCEGAAAIGLLDKPKLVVNLQDGCREAAFPRHSSSPGGLCKLLDEKFNMPELVVLLLNPDCCRCVESLARLELDRGAGNAARACFA